MDMDKINKSIRDWIGELTGKSGDELDALIRDGAAYGDHIEKTEIISRADITVASNILKLTPAELQVLDLMADGMTTKEVAVLLNHSEHTVKQHLKYVRKRLGAKNTTHAVRLAIRTGQLSA